MYTQTTLHFVVVFFLMKN